MHDLPVYLAITGFLAMGLVALWQPRRVTAQFDIAPLSVAGRNEVRAVYGGFGVMTALVLGAALRQPDWRGGVLTAVAAALAGMAGGRVVSAVVDRGIDRGPLRCLVLELAGAAGLAGVA